MRFLANENFPFPSIQLIRDAGYEVISISEENPGITDEVVLEAAVEENLIILTFDRDYGELLFKYQMDPPPAVVYFRVKGQSPPDAGIILLELISSNEIEIEIEGYFTVVEENGYRQRKLG